MLTVAFTMYDVVRWREESIARSDILSYNSGSQKGKPPDDHASTTASFFLHRFLTFAFMASLPIPLPCYESQVLTHVVKVKQRLLLSGLWSACRN